MTKQHKQASYIVEFLAFDEVITDRDYARAKRQEKRARAFEKVEQKRRQNSH